VSGEVRGANMPVSGTPALGSVFGGGLSVTTEGNSDVSAYGPTIGRIVGVVALTVPSILDSTSIDTTFVVLGAAVNDPVILGPPSALSAGVHAFAWVSSAGNVTLRLVSSTGTANQVAGNWEVSILRRSFVTRIV
jgi:hypothetical protein